MKHLFAILALLSTFALAEDYGDSYWIRSYFASVGFGAMATRGDLGDINIYLDNDGKKEVVHTPSTKILGTPDIMLGVNMRHLSFGVNFQYWTFEGELNGFENAETHNKETHNEDCRYWRFGFEFAYNFFYPEIFQVGVGLGYSFTNLSTKNSASSEEGISKSTLMGSGVGAITYIRYYITEHFALSPTLKIYENWFKSVNTKNHGTDDLKSYLWQTYIGVSVNAMVQF